MPDGDLGAEASDTNDMLLLNSSDQPDSNWALNGRSNSCVMPEGSFEAPGGGGGGGSSTARAALPTWPSLLAMMLALPADTAVTSPAADTVATAVFDEDQLIARPVRTLLFESRVVAVA